MASLRSDRNLADAKKREWIRQNDPELRHLQNKIDRAYISQDLRRQLVERQKSQEVRERQHLQEIQEQRALIEEDLAFCQQQDQLRHVKRYQYGQDLERQLVEQERNRKSAANHQSEFDKNIIEEVVAQVQEVERKRIQAKIDEQTRVKEDIDKHLTQRDQWRQDELRKDALEEQKVCLYLKEKAVWVQQQEKLFQERRKRRDHHIGLLAQKLQSTNNWKEWQHDVFWQYQHLQKDSQERRDEHLRQLAQRQKKSQIQELLKQDYEAKQHELARQKTRARLEDQVWQKWMDQMKREQDQAEMDRWSQQRRSWRNDWEHTKQLAQAKSEQERRANQEARHIEKNEIAKRTQIWREERLKIIREHYHKLGESFPTSVLRPEDIDLIATNLP
ncbi:hypothetical protein TCAL_09582 [Tigriopus californicus]|uniref:Meiosis-specific nuclear structural protein 1 n=1 Tax=Tigriopus californicus TaxID=6832 RepID=A0A553PGT3_TIGCA|nr:meiosis-specific nuclear structural protein 1-like [Tigriopus californicus]TRY76890.1 hypothetical protein TCAL_09582 [Tigriopus californicus]|eukprot:TCALIF_09582-PA protein Name:"Similar to Mns1 Meiosis-specific nuclear structural protein 1 (Rattus norvegicus)" AED:0.21 eAED:0.21 QI:0/-1/0/1/-1/1/1/0/388